MRRRLPPCVYREKTRHGRWVLYFRRGKGRRVRLPDDPTAVEFHDAYQAALTGNAPPATRERVSSQSLCWLVDRYRESAAWRQLATATRGAREQLFRQAIAKSGNAPYAAIAQRDIQRGVDGRADTPAQANRFLMTMRGLFVWAKRNGHIEHDPTVGAERVRHRSDGYRPWAVDDVAAYRERHRAGTKARLVLELLLLTGLRRSDIVRVGRQHLRGDTLTIRTAKTGAVVTVRLPAWLLDLIEATPTGDMHFLTNGRGEPATVDWFNKWFRARCREAGVSKSAHGLRKLSATLAAQGGATAHDLMAQYGWAQLSQAETYTRGADRARLGVRASEIVADQIEEMMDGTSKKG